MIYKFVGSTDEAETLRILKSFLESNTLLSSDPASFNDPHEFKVAYDWQASDDEIRATYFADNPSHSTENFETWKSQLEDENWKWWIEQQTRAGLLVEHGVICFAGKYDNHLLWSHYASNHCGFCVAFDEQKLDTLENWVIHGQVEYQEDIPVFNYFHDEKADFVRTSFMYKSEDWNYEEEYRIVLTEQRS